MRPFDQIPLEEWRRVMDVNVASMFLCCRAAVPQLRERGGGAIVNISSGTPFRGVPFLLHYVTSKGAIVAFTRALARSSAGTRSGSTASRRASRCRTASRRTPR
jgi:NAD(P)-dependent dehydrogenase (short-subunit alcohol dehydrogenase family)